jgi:hypothetical protein
MVFISILTSITEIRRRGVYRQIRNVDSKISVCFLRQMSQSEIWEIAVETPSN